MENPVEITYSLHNVLILFSVPFTGTVLDTPDEDELTASLTIDFDYERFPGQNWEVAIDVRLDVKPIIELGVRSVYKTKGKDTHVFDQQSFETIIGQSLKNAVANYKIQCEKLGLEAEEVTFDDLKEHIPEYVETLSKQYIFRREDDKANREIRKKSVSFTPGKNTKAALTGVFYVLDQVMFENPAFNRVHNEEMIKEQIPLVKYFSLKIKAFQIAKQKVELSLKETVLFLILMDAALQLLVGDHYDKLLPGLEAKKFDAKDRDFCIAFNSGFIKQFKKSMKADGARIINLEKQYNWNAMIE